MLVADASPLLTFSAASTWSLPAEAATCVVSVQFDEIASLDAEFASGEFGSGEFDDATNGTNATIPPRPGSEVGVGFYDGPTWRYVEAVIGIIFVYFAFTLIAQAIFGCVMRRSQWWNPPFLTGLVGMGDGSTLPNAIEKFLFKVGWYSAAEDLYFFSQEAENKAASSAPIRIPRSLILQGFRGRSDDPIVRAAVVKANQKAEEKGETGSRLVGAAKVEQAAVAAIMHSQTIEEAREAMEKLRETANLVRAARLVQERWRNAKRWRKAESRRRQVQDAITKYGLHVFFTSADYGSQHFRSIFIASIIAVHSLTFGVVLAFSSGKLIGPQIFLRGSWVYTKKMYEPFIGSMLTWVGVGFAPMTGDAASDAGLMFASFAQTAVLYFLYAVYISVLSVGNVRNCHIRYTWLSTAFVGLGILEQVLSYGCDGFESALTGGASGSFEWSTPELDAARADPRYGNANLGEGAAVSDARGGFRRLADGIFDSARRLSDVAAHGTDTSSKFDSAAFTEEYCRQFNIPSSLGAVEGRDITDWVRSMNNFDWLRLLISVYYLLIMWCYVMILFDHYDVMLNKSSNKVISAITKKLHVAMRKPSIWLANRCGRGAFTKVPVMLFAAIAAEYFMCVLMISVMASLTRVTPDFISSTDSLLVFVRDSVESAHGTLARLQGCEGAEYNAATAATDQLGLSQWWLNILINAFPIVVWAGIVGAWVGIAAALFLTYGGTKATISTYHEAYDLLWKNGHAALRFPLERANSVRLMSTLVFYHLYGLLGLMGIGAIGGFVVGLIIVDSPLQYMLRPLIAHCVVAIITEMLYVRKVVTPFFQFLSCGPALYAIEMWYLSLGLLKGFTRMVTLVGLVIMSNFNPQACMFPDGKEATDSAHVCFLCYTAERVAHDKAAQRQWRAAYQEAVNRRKKVLGNITAKLSKKGKRSVSPSKLHAIGQTAADAAARLSPMSRFRSISPGTGFRSSSPTAPRSTKKLQGLLARAAKAEADLDLDVPSDRDLAV